MIRKASFEDIPTIYELGAMLHEDYKKLNNLEFLFHQDYFKAFVAEEDQRVVGFLTITEFYETVDIVDLYVIEAARGRKVASRLLNFMFGCISLNVELFTLEVAVDNVVALHLYQNFGFEIECIRKGYYGDRDAYLLGKRCSDHE